jgi:hypothetical protein
MFACAPNGIKRGLEKAHYSQGRRGGYAVLRPAVSTLLEKESTMKRAQTDDAVSKKICYS